MLWHPHQKLWNHRLLTTLRRLPRLAALPLVAAVVLLDSMLLLARATTHWVTSVCAAGFRRKRVPILYVDCGTHKDGREIVYFHRWFGQRHQIHTVAFEASPSYAASAAQKLASLKADVRHVALIGPQYRSDTVRLFRRGGDGRGDSLFEARGHEYDEVPAMRLSTVLKGADFSLDSSVVLLRMNIEGAESMVIEDLADSGVLGRIDGFYGMWDDLSKIDFERDKEFCERLRELDIHSFTFNERDLRFTIRRLAIYLDLSATIRTGSTRKSRAANLAV